MNLEEERTKTLESKKAVSIIYSSHQIGIKEASNSNRGLNMPTRMKRKNMIKEVIMII